MNDSNFHRGDVVVYRKQKSSTSPGPRAKDIHASSGGEGYRYVVDKYWIVEAVEDEAMLLRTRRGKVNRVPFDDPRVRPARLWERWVHRDRFEQLRRGLQNHDTPSGHSMQTAS